MASPSTTNTPAPQWRYTPPPTTSAVRSNKRKCEFSTWFMDSPSLPNMSYTVDDRFDPYPSSSKRRAVSPSISYFREAHGSLHTRNPGTPRLSIPIATPVSTVNSATSSYNLHISYLKHSRHKKWKYPTDGRFVEPHYAIFNGSRKSCHKTGATPQTRRGRGEGAGRSWRGCWRFDPWMIFSLSVYYTGLFREVNLSVKFVL